MAIALSTAGVTVQYAVETTSGTRPTTGYTIIPDLKSIPALNPEPSNLETTPLSALEWRTYIAGLRDTGGALQFTANHTEEFHTAWNALVDAAENAKADGNATWFAVVVPGLANAFYFSGEPSDLGLTAIEVDAVLEAQPYIVPTDVEGWATKPTGA